MYGEEVYCGTAIGTVVTGPSTWEFLFSMLNLQYAAKQFRLAFPYKEGIDAARNELVVWFLAQTSCLNLLLLDSDVILPRGGITGLARWEKPIVSAVVPQRKPPYAPMGCREHLSAKSVWQHKLDPPLLEKIGELVRSRAANLGQPLVDVEADEPLWEIREGSTHCLLVERDVFLKVNYPWFGGETSFYKRAYHQGYTGYLDTSVMVGHQASRVATMLDFAVWDIATKQGEGHAKETHTETICNS